jgi:hypothetical protein
MKFSDMMGKGNKTEDADAETAAVAARLNAPPVPEAPVQFGGNRSETTSPVEVPEASTAPVTEPVMTEPVMTEPVAIEPVVHTIDTQVSMADVMSELVPRVGASVTAAAPAELDASAWLDGLTIVDDDLLPS